MNSNHGPAPNWAMALAASILILALALTPGTLAYTYGYMYRPPEPTIVNESSVSPDVLMPGENRIVYILDRVLCRQ